MNHCIDATRQTQACLQRRFICPHGSDYMVHTISCLAYGSLCNHPCRNSVNAVVTVCTSSHRECVTKQPPQATSHARWLTCVPFLCGYVSLDMHGNFSKRVVQRETACTTRTCVYCVVMVSCIYEHTQTNSAVAFNYTRACVTYRPGAFHFIRTRQRTRLHVFHAFTLKRTHL